MILIALGANLPGPDGAAPLDTCRRAAGLLDGLLGCPLRGLSRWFLTRPVPDLGQPPYVNGVAALGGTADPADLLRALLALEDRFGRVRVPGSLDRTLDLDLLAMGSLVLEAPREAPGPVLPHPRLHERRFVLEPLCDLLPDWQHPVLGRSARNLLLATAGQSVRPLAA